MTEEDLVRIEADAKAISEAMTDLRHDIEDINRWEDSIYLSGLHDDLESFSHTIDELGHMIENDDL